MPVRKDRHKGVPLNLRLSEVLVQAIKDSAAENRRKIVQEVQIALERHLESVGRWPPKP